MRNSRDETGQPPTINMKEDNEKEDTESGKTSEKRWNQDRKDVQNSDANGDSNSKGDNDEEVKQTVALLNKWLPIRG